MVVIADTSVIVKWFVKEPDSDTARSLKAGAFRLLAPDSMIVEFANAIWKKQRAGDITPQQAETAIVEFHRELSGGLLELALSLELLLRAFQMAKILRHTVYDCVFLALSEASGGVMITDDARFVRRVRRSEWRKFIRPLADLA